MHSVVVSHREATTLSDRLAWNAVRMLRWGLDRVTGYKHAKAVALHNKDPAAAEQKYAMDERKYLIRNLFLESCGRRAGHGGRHVAPFALDAPHEARQWLVGRLLALVPMMLTAQDRVAARGELQRAHAICSPF